MATFSAVLAHAQDEERTFFFSHPVSLADLTAIIGTVRTVVDLRDVSYNLDPPALKVHAPAEKMLATDWLLRQLDAPPDQAAERPLGRETIGVMPVSPSATGAEITALVTAIRTTADLQRIFPLQSQKVIVGRGPAETVVAAEWLIQQLLPREGKTPDGDSAAHSSPVMTGEKEKPILQVFRMNPAATSAQLFSAVTAIRTAADLQRTFPFDSGKAIVTSGAPGKVELAGWLVHELSKPEDEKAVHQTVLPDAPDEVVRLFLVPDKSEVAALADQVRETLQLRRVYSFPAGLLVRARPDEVSIAAIMVESFIEHAR